MKIERVNDSQIRCTLSNFDLVERNINLSELAYGSEGARRLFREMIQKASAEVGFEAEEVPLMVEAIPLSNESVMLVITKVDDPEEMDTRFSRFAPAPTAEFAETGFDPIESGLEGGASFTPLRNETEHEPTGRIRVFTFETLDKVIDAAAAMRGLECGTNALYKNPQNGTYHLVLSTSAAEDQAFSSVCNMLQEYGTRARQNYSSESYYCEHFDVILRANALQSLAKIG